MRIYVDATEPGAIFQAVRRDAERTGIPVERVLLHKRIDLGAAHTVKHPLYGTGCDYLVTDDALIPHLAVERKSLEDLARSASVGRATEGPRFFRQMQDLRRMPTPILILEGEPSFLYRRLEPAMIGLQFWLAREGIAIIRTTNPSASARAICILARKLRADFDLRPEPEAELALAMAGAEPTGAEGGKAKGERSEPGARTR